MFQLCSNQNESIVHYLLINQLGLNIKEISKFISMDQKTLENELKNCKVRQGLLYKRSKFLKEWRQRWIVLTMNYLFTFTNKSCKEVTDIIDLKEMKSYKSYLRKDEQMIPAGFKIRCDDNEFYFCGRNCNQKWSWIVTIQRLMDYKYVGSSAYNNIQFVRTRGFSSQAQFENGTKVEKTPQITNNQNDIKNKSAEQAKKQVDNEVQMIMKELENQKQQLKKKQLQFTQKQRLLKQQQQALALRKQEEQSKKQFQKKIQEANSPKRIQQTAQSKPNLQKQQENIPPTAQNQKINNLVFGSKVSELKSMFQQKIVESFKDVTPSLRLTYDVQKFAKQKSIVEDLASLRSRTVTNLFEQFHNQSPQPQALRFILDFLVKIASDTKYGYYAPIVAQTKSHKNKRFLSQAFVELITDYKDLQNCDILTKFIEICLFEAPEFFQQGQVLIIKNKLIDFFLAVEEDRKLEVILKNMFIVSKMNKYSRNEIVKSKLSRVAKQCKREETKNWARKLVDQF